MQSQPKPDTVVGADNSITPIPSWLLLGRVQFLICPHFLDASKQGQGDGCPRSGLNNLFIILKREHIYMFKNFLKS